MSLSDTATAVFSAACLFAVITLVRRWTVREMMLNEDRHACTTAAGAGLEVYSHHLGWGSELSRVEFRGERNGVRLRLIEVRAGRGRASCTLVAVTAPSPLRLERRSPADAVTEAGTGSEAFDRRLAITRGAELGMSVLNAATRRQLCELRRTEDRHAGAMMEDGVLTVSRSGSLQEQRIEEWVAGLVELCTRLAPPADPRAALIDNARSDFDWEVRVRMLEQLWCSFPADGEVLSLIGERLQTADPRELVAIACRFPGPKSEAALRRLAATADAANVLPGMRARALEELVRQRGQSDLSALVIQALSSSERCLRGAAIKAVTELELHAAVEALCELAQTEDDEEKVAVLDALQSLGDSRAEPVAIASLRSRSPAVQRAAVRTLREVGTLRAVGALSPIARPYRLHHGVHAEALNAMRAIQARLEVQGEGALQLAASDASVGALAAPLDTGALASPTASSPQRPA